jgi:hypothetical protein
MMGWMVERLHVSRAGIWPPSLDLRISCAGELETQKQMK